MGPTSSKVSRTPRGEMIDYLVGIVGDFPIVSVEDGLAEDDWDGWHLLTERLTDAVQLVGDDIFVTNRDLLRRGIADHVANSILIKVNQIGTLSETLATMEMADTPPWVVSSAIAPARPRTPSSPTSSLPPTPVRSRPVPRPAGERTSKYNQLLRIEERLGDGARFAGWDPYPQRKR